MNERNSTITGTNMKVHGSKLTYFTMSFVFNPVKTGSLNDLTDLKFSFHVSVVGTSAAIFSACAQKKTESLHGIKIQMSYIHKAPVRPKPSSIR
jgi:hypothetical protein